MAQKHLLQQIVNIEKRTFGPGGVNIKTLQSLEETFQDGLIILKNNGDVIAYLGWEKHTREKFPPYNHDVSKTHEPTGKLAYISIITVKKEFRNQGYGTKLLRLSEKIAKKHKCKKIYCPVNKKHPYLNKGVMQFWNKNGFIISREIDWKFAKGKKLPSFVFTKKL